MPTVGEHDVFESSYMARLKAELAPHGLLIDYDKDRAALDLGIHLYAPKTNGSIGISSARVWIQAKGKRADTFTAAEFADASVVPVSVSTEHARYWFAAPEAVYLVVYVASVDVFLAADIRDLIEEAGGLGSLLKKPGQASVTLEVPTSATLARAVEAMPRHRSMRIDGMSWRGRPLGHGYDPLRSELAPFEPSDFDELISELLAAHDFRIERSVKLLGTTEGPVGPVAIVGRLTLTYEWVHPMMTEFGFDRGSDFRIEGEANFAQGDVLVVIDPLGELDPKSVEAELAPLVEVAEAKGIRRLLYFGNSYDSPEAFGQWFNVSPQMECMPQHLGSLTFNVLTTTMVYLKFLDRLNWRFVNYL